MEIIFISSQIKLIKFIKGFTKGKNSLVLPISCMTQKMQDKVSSKQSINLLK